MDIFGSHYSVTTPTYISINITYIYVYTLTLFWSVPEKGKCLGGDHEIIRASCLKRTGWYICLGVGGGKPKAHMTLSLCLRHQLLN